MKNRRKHNWLFNPHPHPDAVKFGWATGRDMLIFFAVALVVAVVVLAI